MIDTITLLIPMNDFRITDYEAFTPSAKGMFEAPYYSLGKGGKFPCVQNPTKKELKKGIYKPKLTLLKSIINNDDNSYSFSICLIIEFSAPKLLFGNNFNELDDNSFIPLINKLQTTLHEMFVEIEAEKLINAKVIKIHYGKNLIVTEYATCYEILKAISKADITSRLDNSETDYNNNGCLVRYRAKSYELCFYDKMKDLYKATKISKARAFEQDSEIQASCLEANKGMEVLRMEYRINDMDKLKKDLFLKLNINIQEMTLQNLFQKDIARRVCLHFWNITHEGLSAVILSENEDVSSFQNLKHIGYKPQKAAEIAQALLLIRQGYSMREIKNMSLSWYKLVQGASEQRNLRGCFLYGVFLNIRRSLEAFESIRMSIF